jgi:hypothetical protein
MSWMDISWSSEWLMMVLTFFFKALPIFYSILILDAVTVKIYPIYNVNLRFIANCPPVLQNFFEEVSSGIPKAFTECTVASGYIYIHFGRISIFFYQL